MEADKAGPERGREGGRAGCSAVGEGVTVGAWEYGEGGEGDGLGVYHFMMSGLPLTMELFLAACRTQRPK